MDLTGYTPDELQGKTFTELGLWQPGEREKASETYRSTGRLTGYEIGARHRKGEDRTWLISSEVVQLWQRTLLTTSLLDITRRKEMAERIHSLLEEKEVLLKEVHRRIRNNLGQIISLLNLQASREMKPAVTEILNDVVNRVHGMLALYDLVYAGTNYGGVSIREFLNLLTTRLRSSFPFRESIAVNLEVEELTLTHKTVSPLGQIVNELFTNSMKHAFEDTADGEIHIALRQEGDELVLEYGDTGRGMNRDANQPSAGGSAGESGGFGTILIAALASQLGAVWSIDGPPGTRYCFRFRPV